jgi:hypothetical protein
MIFSYNYSMYVPSISMGTPVCEEAFGDIAAMIGPVTTTSVTIGCETEWSGTHLSGSFPTGLKPSMQG